MQIFGHNLVINLSSSIRLHKEGNHNLRAPKKEASNFVFKCLDLIFDVETILALCWSAQCVPSVVLAVVIWILSKHLLILYNGQGKSLEYLFRSYLLMININSYQFVTTFNCSLVVYLPVDYLFLFVC